MTHDVRITYENARVMRILGAPRGERRKRGALKVMDKEWMREIECTYK